METIEEKILNRVDEKELDAFIISDFLDLGSYSSIGKSLKKLCQKEIIEEIMPGLYSKIFKIEGFKGNFYGAGSEEIAKALARKHNWNIINTGNKALNWMGISQQVPAKSWFLSDGPDRVYRYKKHEITFFHVSSKEVAELPFPILLSIQAIKNLGKNYMNDYTRTMIARFLNVNKMKISNYNNVKVVKWIKDELNIIEKDYANVTKIPYFGKL